MGLLDILLPPGGGSTIGNVVLDATLSEMHRKTNNVTTHPVEEGAAVTDHINQQPDEFDLTGLVSDFPVYWAAPISAPSPLIDDPDLGIEGRSKKAYNELSRIMEDGLLVDVVTTFKTYENMALLSMNVPKDASTANEARVTLSLRQIVTVVSKTTSAPVTESKADSSPAGKKKVTPKDAATENPAVQNTATPLDDLVGVLIPR